MTLDEVRAAREITEGKVRALLRDLERETGCLVLKCYLTRVYTLPGVSYPEALLDLDVGRLLRGETDSKPTTTENV
jgi:hypothetical protein